MTGRSAGRRIAILGAGREGRSVLRWFRDREPGAQLTVIAEQPPEADFTAAVPAGADVRVEPLEAERLVEFDLLVRSPGISLHRQALREARERGAVFTTATNLWFAAHPAARTLCITGTKGKSTTSALTAHILRSCGLEVQLAGNIGTPLLDCADDGFDWWVVELSSYQIADLEGRPDIAMILNLSPEHLDWHGSVEGYYADKLRLADRVRPAGDIAQGSGSRGLVLNAGDPELAARFAGRQDVTWFGNGAGAGSGTGTGIHVTAGGIAYSARELPVTMPVTLPGRHNRLNVAAALTAARLAGVDVVRAAESVAGFRGLPHRLQVLGESEGVTFVNDSIASAPVATAAALEAFAGRPLVLIVGGFDRGLDWSRHLDDLRQHPPRAVIGVPDNGPRIAETLRAGGLECPAGFHGAATLEDAMRQARKIVRPGDAVLLSPGAPSFPHFRDYRDRGQAFARLAGFPPIEE